jgi:hypothetical protein
MGEAWADHCPCESAAALQLPWQGSECSDTANFGWVALAPESGRVERWKGFAIPWRDLGGRRLASVKDWQETTGEHSHHDHERCWVQSCGSYLRLCRCEWIVKTRVGGAAAEGGLLGLVAKSLVATVEN